MANESLNDLVPSNNPQINKSGPRIFVICLAAYNNGLMHGVWINAAQDAHKIQKEIKKMLLESPIPGAEDFGIHAIEGVGSLTISGCESIKSVQRMAMFVTDLGDLGAELLVYFGDVDSAQEAWENHYQGEYEHEIEFAIQLFEELYMSSIPEVAQGYIDYASFKRDIFIGDFFSLIVNGRYHIFSRC